MDKFLRLVVVTLLLAIPATAQIPTAEIINVPVSTAITATIDLWAFRVNPSGKESVAYPLVIYPPAALEATSYALLPYVCTSASGAACLPLADKGGSIIRFVLVGGATPTHAVQVDPATLAGVRYLKLQVVSSTDVAVVQTAARIFWLFVRPL